MNIYSAISIEWDNEPLTIDRNVHRELVELALTRVSAMILDGFVSGELHESVYDRISGEDICYTGNWRIHYSD